MALNGISTLDILTKLNLSTDGKIQCEYLGGSTTVEAEAYLETILKQKKNLTTTAEQLLILDESVKKIIENNYKDIVLAIQVLEQVRHYIDNLDRNNINHESFSDIVVGLISSLGRSGVNSNYHLQRIQQDYRKIEEVLKMPLDLKIYERLKPYSFEQLERGSDNLEMETEVELVAAEYLNPTPEPGSSNIKAVVIAFLTAIKAAFLYRIRLYTASYVKPPRAARSRREILKSLQSSTPVHPDVILRPDIVEQAQPYDNTEREGDILLDTNAFVMPPPSTGPARSSAAAPTLPHNPSGRQRRHF